MKRLLSIILVLFLTIGLSLPVCAEPTDAFTHDEGVDGVMRGVLSAEMYVSTRRISAATLGLEEQWSELTDLYCDSSGKVYILDGGFSSITVLNSDYSLNRVIYIKDENGSTWDFTGARGIFVDDNGDIYICDFINGQILIADSQGNLKKIWGSPDAKFLPDNFYFQPSRMVKDKKGYAYVLNLGDNYGALVYSPELDENGNQTFVGFYGANQVKASALDTLSFIWDKLTKTDEKRAMTTKKLPDAFVDLCLDSKGYMITCTGQTEGDNNGVGQIRKLSPGGQDILYKRNTRGESTNSSTVNFLEDKVIRRFGSSRPQNIVAIDIDENDFIYALDKTHALIYIYDNECNLLAGFGGGTDYASQLGIFDSPVDLALVGSDVLVADKDTYSVTVFERTEYGQLLIEAQSKHLKGEYDEAAPLWEKVLGHNSSCQLAYRGLAIAHYTEGDYEKALEYAKKGLDYTTYDLAWKVILNKKLSDHFAWIFTGAVLLIGGFVFFLIYKKKKGIILIKNPKLKVALSASVHPFQSFEDISYRHMGSLRIAGVLLLLFYLSKMLDATASGFLALKSDPRSYNALYTVLGTIGLVVLWSVANWLIASLSSGKGKWKDVFTVSCYCTIPLTIFTFLRVLLSHFLPLSGIAIMDAIGTAVLIFTLFILCIGIMQVHEYDFFKFLTTTIVTILFMILIVSVLLLVGVLLGQVYGFIEKLYQEAVFR